MVFLPKPPPHGTLVAPLQEKRPRQPPPAHMFELLLKSQPYLMPNTHGVVDWPVVSLAVQLVAAATPWRASSTRPKSPIAAGRGSNNGMDSRVPYSVDSSTPSRRCSGQKTEPAGVAGVTRHAPLHWHEKVTACLG